MMPLPVVLRPLAEETPHSWLNRAVAVYRMPLDQLVSPPLSDLHSLMLACNFTTLQTLATLTRTPPDFLLAHTVASWTSQERLQWLTIWQTEPSWMLPHYEFRLQLTTNYCESCLLEDANTTGIEFFRLHWLLASSADHLSSSSDVSSRNLPPLQSPPSTTPLAFKNEIRSCLRLDPKTTGTGTAGTSRPPRTGPAMSSVLRTIPVGGHPGPNY
jgi:hypothetical protein